MKDKNNQLGWQRILLLILPYFIIVGLFQYTGALISGVDVTQIETEITLIQKLTLSFFNLLGTFLIIWIFMKFIDKEKFVNLGFYSKNRFKEFIVGIVIGLIIMSVGYFLLIFLEEINFERFFFDYKEMIFSILLFIMIAIVEEVLYRGYILRNLMFSFNKYIALIISSLLFSLMHSFNPNADLFALTNIFLAGLLLGISYIHTKNLWFPIALHLSWNFFQTIFGFNVSGLDTYSLIEFNIIEENLLNGGAFGFEGSILSVIAILVTIIGIEIYYKRQKITNKIAQKTEHNF